MSSAAHQRKQWAGRYDTHVTPLNAFVDSLGEVDGAGPPPYIAPMYRGTGAHGLAVLRDPGPRAGGAKGSGFLSVENDDPTAERQLGFKVEAGLDPSEVVPWNAYPWYINRAPSAVEMRQGTEPLKRVLGLLPELRVVLLLGATPSGPADTSRRVIPAWRPSGGSPSSRPITRAPGAVAQGSSHESGAEADLRSGFREPAVILASPTPTT